MTLFIDQNLGCSLVNRLQSCFSSPHKLNNPNYFEAAATKLLISVSLLYSKTLQVHVAVSMLPISEWCALIGVGYLYYYCVKTLDVAC